MHLKMVTYNIYHGFHEDQVVQTILKLSSLGVSLFGLQEVANNSISQTLLYSLGPEWRAETLIKPNSFSLGLCLLWKTDNLQLVKAQHLLLPRLGRFNFYESFIEKIIIRLVKKPVQRGAIIATFRLINGKLLRITDLHLDWEGHFEQRAKQLNYLTSHLKTPFDYEIVSGDFNTVGLAAFSGNQEKKIRAILGSKFIDAYPKTDHTTNIDEHLDYIFVKGLKVAASEIVKLGGSDHFPLMAELEAD